jgi:hypothetical protein
MCPFQSTLYTRGGWLYASPCFFFSTSSRSGPGPTQPRILWASGVKRQLTTPLQPVTRSRKRGYIYLCIETKTSASPGLEPATFKATFQNLQQRSDRADIDGSVRAALCMAGRFCQDGDCRMSGGGGQWNIIFAVNRGRRANAIRH